MANTITSSSPLLSVMKAEAIKTSPVSDSAGFSDMLQQITDKSSISQPTTQSLLLKTEVSRQDKPDLKQFMDATGADFDTANQYLNRYVGKDTRDWQNIMNADNPMAAVKQATNEMNFSVNATDQSKLLLSQGYQPISQPLLAKSGPIAVWQDSTTPSGTPLYRIGLLRDDGYAVVDDLNFNDAAKTLKTLDRFGVDKALLNTIADQLDAKGIAYKPYQLYAGTGSDAGIDFRDLASGGMGTASDWTKDSNATLKDNNLETTHSAVSAIAEAKALAERLGVVKNPSVTTEQGIKTDYLSQQIADGKPYNYVVANRYAASWHATPEAALAAQAQLGGALIDVSDKPAQIKQEQLVVPTTSDTVQQQTAIKSSANAPIAVAMPVVDTSTQTNSVATNEVAVQEKIDQFMETFSPNEVVSMSKYMANYAQMRAMMAKLETIPV